MTKTTTIKRTLTVAIAILASSGLAQGMGGGRRGAIGPRLYDPATVVTLKGQVAAVTMIGPMGLGVRLELKTGEGTTVVHVGPLWFLQEGKLTVAAGDEVEITGSRVTLDGEPTVIAREIHKGAQALTLRDAEGFPLWAGRGLRRR